MARTRTRKAKYGNTKKATQPVRPRVKRIDPGSATFQEWMSEAQQASPRRASARPISVTIPSPREAARAIRALLTYVHAYMNVRPRVDVNTCGQAAISTLLDFHSKDPFHLERKVTDSVDRKQYWIDGEVIDSVKKSGFGPNALGGAFGTTPGRIKEALSSFGLTAEVTFANASRKSVAWADLQAFVAQGKPAPVLVDCTYIGGPQFGLHWAIAYRIENDQVYLGNWRPDPFPADVFLNAWQCSQVPLFVRDYHYCAVYVDG